MQICLSELRRCQEGPIKPNFLVLRDNRDGWDPLSETLPFEGFDALAMEMSRHVAPDAPALLKHRYQRDDNAVPRMFELKPRECRFEDFRVWATEVERPILADLNSRITATSPRKTPAAFSTSKVLPPWTTGGIASWRDCATRISCFSFSSRPTSTTTHR